MGDGDDVSLSRQVGSAENIPGAQFVALPEGDHFLTGHYTKMQSEIVALQRANNSGVLSSRFSATVCR